MPDEPLQFDATDDYVTCPHCRTLRPVDELWCSRCARIASLTVERFGLVEDER